MEKLCRTCLRMPDTLVPLFSDEKLCSKIEIISNIELQLLAEFPKEICEECICYINLAFNFRTVIINSDMDLKQRLPHLLKIQTETIVPGDDDDILSKPKDGKIKPEVVETESDNASRNEVVCDTCGKMYADRKPYYAHRKTAHRAQEQKQHLLHLIKIQTESDNETHSKLEEEETKSQNEVICDTCGKMYANPKSYKAHRRTAHQALERKYKCETCGKGFFRKQVLQRHMRIHTEVRLYICNVCGKGLSTEWSLHSHRKVHAKRTNPNYYKLPVQRNETVIVTGKPSGVERQCTRCSFSCTNHEEWLKHCNTHYQLCLCTVCGKRVRSSYLVTHMKHHVRDPITCHMCGRILKNRVAFQLHLSAMHRGMKYKCDMCDKVFELKQSCERHRLTHFDLERKFKCGVCDWAFYENKLLKRHMKVHTGERPFSCEVCGKMVSSRYALNVHARVHTKEKPFKCRHCSAVYAHKPALTAHMSSKHAAALDEQQSH